MGSGLGGSLGIFVYPGVSGWDLGPSFWGRFSTLVGGVAPGLICSPFQASAKPGPLHRSKERKLSAGLKGASMEGPLEEARQKLWRNLRMLPKMGRKVQKQLKSHLATLSSSSVTNGSETGTGDTAWENNVDKDPFVATSLASPAQPQAPRNRQGPSRKTSRSVSWNEAASKVKDWHQTVVRVLSLQASKPGPVDLREPQDSLPEEYRPPPPFAPGYC